MDILNAVLPQLLHKFLLYFQYFVEFLVRLKQYLISFLPEQVIERANTASMSLSTIVEGLCAAIEAIVDTKEDLKVTGGATH